VRATGGGERRVRQGASERRRMGRVAAARGVRIRVWDVASARRYDSGGRSERIRMSDFF
jgi:hypothetical protein